MEPEALREFRALLERAGGRQEVLLVGEARDGDPPQRQRAMLESFARELFAEDPPPPPEEPPRSPAAARRVRVRLGSRRRRRLSCALLFVLFRASSLLRRPERLRLREILRDLRSQLPSGAAPALVGVVLLEEEEPRRAGARSPPRSAGAEEARLRMDALLRQVFQLRRGRRRRPGIPDTLQAALYAPGEPQGAADVWSAASTALRAALKLRGDGMEAKTLWLAAFLQCIPWGRRNQRRKGHLAGAASNLNEDGLPDLEEGVPLTNIAPNGNCEEACGEAGT